MLCELPTAVNVSDAGETASKESGGVIAAACEMLTVRVRPPPANVMVAVRAAPVLAATVTFTVLSLEPEAGETVAHAAELTAVQLTLEETVILCELSTAVNVSDAGESVSEGAGVGAATVCEMLTVRVRPPPVNVIVAVRPLLVLVVTVTLIAPLLLPEAGETVAHVALLVAVQLTLDATVILCELPTPANSSDIGETVSEEVGVDAAAACERLTARVIPPPVNVTVSLRAPPVLAANVMLTVPLLLPEAGETVAHAVEVTAVQLTLEVTMIF